MNTEATMKQHEIDELKSDNKHLNDLLDNALNEVETLRNVLNEIETYIDKYAGLYFDEDVTKELSKILDKVKEK